MHKRRRARRMRASEAGVVRQARLLPGGDAVILNISNTGLLVENKTRLSVGSTVNVRLEGASVMGIEGHIVRSRVAAIHRDGSMSYEMAIEFDRPQSIDGHDIGTLRADAPLRTCYRPRKTFTCWTQPMTGNRTFEPDDGSPPGGAAKRRGG